MEPLFHSPQAVLFDRDDTLIVDVPYNGDPSLVSPMPTVPEALQLLRERGIPIGVISNQSGVGRGLITIDDVRSVNDRVEELLGPFDVWRMCPHTAEEGCGCRKPEPGLIISAASALRIAPADTVMIGDIGADVGAAAATGAAGILVPTPRTRQEEVEAAHTKAATVLEAVETALALKVGA